jgi:hypothetical protein
VAETVDYQMQHVFKSIHATRIAAVAAAAAVRGPGGGGTVVAADGGGGPSPGAGGVPYLRVNAPFGEFGTTGEDNISTAMDSADIGNMKRLENFGRQLAKRFQSEISDFAKIPLDIVAPEELMKSIIKA